MPISLKCNTPACGKRFQVRDQLSGKAFKCPGCGAAILVPSSSPEIDWDALAQEERRSQIVPAPSQQKQVQQSKKAKGGTRSKAQADREMHPLAFFLVASAFVSLLACLVCGIVWNFEIAMGVLAVVFLGPGLLVGVKHLADGMEQGTKNLGGGLIVALIWGPATFILLPIMSVFGTICGTFADLLFRFYVLLFSPLGLRPSGSLFGNTNDDADAAERTSRKPNHSRSSTNNPCEHEQTDEVFDSRLRQSFRDWFFIVQRLAWFVAAVLFVGGFAGIYYLAKRDLQPPSPESREQTIRRMMERVGPAK